MINKRIAISILSIGLIAVAFAGCGRGAASSGGTQKSDVETSSPKLDKATVKPAAIQNADSAAAPKKADGHIIAAADDDSDEPPVSQPVFRPSDDRPKHDDAKLEKFGIRKFESKRLVLYTDIDPEIAKTLPPYVDALYDALVAYFGPLPPNRERSELQLTGYIIADKELFRQADILTVDVPKFVHGKHQGYRFWMNEQKYDYYRRHLMLHEATHCFMMIMPDTRALTWYLEGMAEVFGTHHADAMGQLKFGIMPEVRNDFIGWERIEMVRREIAAGHFRSLDDINHWSPNDYFEGDRYAWSWALCQFLNSHPRYRDAFHRLGLALSYGDFEAAVRDAFNADLPRLRTEWPLFVHSLEVGFDIERAAIDFRPGKPLSSPAETSIASDRGWQSSEVLVEKGKEYEVTATGRVTLANEPKPWISEAQGISYTYSEGRPVGMLLAAIHSRSGPNDVERETMLDVIPIGAKHKFTAPVTGTLYFRVNDFWSKLRDNTGAYKVRITP